MVGGIISLQAFNGLGFEIVRHISFPGFTVTLLPNGFINFSVSVENLNIRGRESSQGDFKAQSGKSDALQDNRDIQHVRAFILHSSEVRPLEVSLCRACTVSHNVRAGINGRG